MNKQLTEHEKAYIKTMIDMSIVACNSKEFQKMNESLYYKLELGKLLTDK